MWNWRDTDREEGFCRLWSEVQAAGVAVVRVMQLSDLVRAESVAFVEGVTTRKQTFERIGAQLAGVTGVPAGAIARALGEREQLGTTGFGGGTAIPHGRLPEVQSLHAAVIRLPTAIDWQAMDGIAVDLVIALIGPDQASGEYLKALALISRTLRDHDAVRKMRGAADAHALWALVAGREKKAA